MPEQQEENQQQTNTGRASTAPDAEAAYEAALAERSVRIAELEAGNAAATRAAEGAGDEERVGFELQYSMNTPSATSATTMASSAPHRYERVAELCESVSTREATGVQEISAGGCAHNHKST